MCGRYALALRPSQIRRMLEDDNVPVTDAPEDEGSGAPRQTYNFAPGYYGVVYRADTPDRGAGARRDHTHHREETDEADEADVHGAKGVRYKLQSMRWGLIPFWTKRNPDYASVMRTINCRDDSLSAPGGMWATMKARKRCIVIAQGFFEWLRTSSKDKLPHYVRRRDGRLMCFAGLWDCVQYEGTDEKHYTYTIITTDSNKQLRFLHDRMPVIFDPDSDKLRKWLDPSHHEWSCDLQSLLKPFDGELEVYPVSKDVGKVGNDSPSFIVSLDSKENKSNIANFFTNAPRKQEEKKAIGSTVTRDQESTVADVKTSMESDPQACSTIAGPATADRKRKAAPGTGDNPPSKKVAPKLRDRPETISSSRNKARSPTNSNPPGTQKITKFFPQNA